MKKEAWNCKRMFSHALNRWKESERPKELVSKPCVLFEIVVSLFQPFPFQFSMGQDGRLADLWKIMDGHWTPPPTRKTTSEPEHEPEQQLAIKDGKVNSSDTEPSESDSEDHTPAPAHAKSKAIKGAAVVKHARSLERKSMSGQGAPSVPSMPAAASQPSKVDLPTPRKEDIMKKRELVLAKLEHVRQGL